MSLRNHSEIAWQYADDVLKEKTPTSKYLKLQVQKCVDDLTDEHAPMVYSDDYASHYCEFIESNCTHVKDRLSGKPFILAPWQTFMHCMTYGWRYRDDIERRWYQEILLLAARKQGKTISVAAQALYHLVFEGDRGQIRSMAINSDQSKYCWDDAAAMIQNSKKLQKVLRVRNNLKIIENRKSGTSFKYLSKGIAQLNGMSPNIIFFDEASEYTDEKMFSEITTGQGSIYAPLNVYFSTASHLLDGPYHKKLETTMRRLDGISEKNNQEFALLYMVDPSDQPFDRACWPKASPNLHVSASMEDLEKWAAKAEAGDSAAMDAFLIKKLCKWVRSTSKWVATPHFKRNVIKIKDFDERVNGLECIIGVDLSVSKDLTAIVFRFHDEKTGDYYLTHKCFLPKVSMSSLPKTYLGIYSQAVVDGYLELVDTPTIDVTVIAQYLKDMGAKYNVISYNIDPAYSVELVHILNRAGLRTKTIPPVMKLQSPIITEIERKVGQDKIHIIDEGLFMHQLDNAMIEVNTNGQKKIVNGFNKNNRNHNNKIDSIDSMVNCFTEQDFLRGQKIVTEMYISQGYE